MSDANDEPILKRLRKQRGLIKEAARFVGVDRGNICKWDNMLVEPHRRYRQKYADFLGITVGQLGSLFYEESVKERPPRPRRRREKGVKP